MCSIGMALRASELVGLQVSDVFDGEKVKSYVDIRAETAKFKKERTIRIGDDIQRAIADFIAWKVSKGESIDLGWSHTARLARCYPSKTECGHTAKPKGTRCYRRNVETFRAACVPHFRALNVYVGTVTTMERFFAISHRELP